MSGLFRKESSEKKSILKEKRGTFLQGRQGGGRIPPRMTGAKKRADRARRQETHRQETHRQTRRKRPGRRPAPASRKRTTT